MQEIQGGRHDSLTWDEYFHTIAEAVRVKSKDPKCQVGAVISRDRLVISTGFNGFARGVLEDDSRWNSVDEKLKWVCHAEINAIFNAARIGISTQGCSIHVTKFPCFGCCNAIVQAGITRIHTLDGKFWDDDPTDPDHSLKRALLSQVGIAVKAPRHPAYNPQPQS